MAGRTASQLQPALDGMKKLLRVALIGAPNAGKSTLLNRLVMSEVSCVSNKVHTTRDNVLGVYTENNTQLEFYDSPGTVTRKHLLKHHLEDSLLEGPATASQHCDLIGVVVDASNLRDCQRMSRSILSILEEHENKKSFLILNKVDLVKAKRILLDIATRLSEGHLNGQCMLEPQELERLLLRHSGRPIKATSPHVIELSKESNKADSTVPSRLGFRNFERIFSISALQDDGVDELRENMINLAQPVVQWPHGPDYLTNQSTKHIVHAIIRGNVMDNVEREIPYVVRYKYLQCKMDELGSLHIDLELRVPKKYMIGKLLGQNGSIIFKITNESRDRIQNQLACDAKLNITVTSIGGA